MGHLPRFVLLIACFGCNSVFGIEERPPSSAGTGLGTGGMTASGGGGAGGMGGGGSAPVFGDELAPAWGMTFGSDGINSAVDIAVHPSGDPVVVGAFGSQLTIGSQLVTVPVRGLYVARIDVATREPVFVTHLEASAVSATFTRPSSVLVDEAGDIYMSAFFVETITQRPEGDVRTAAAPADGLIAKYDGETGARQWLQQIGGSEYVLPQQLAFDPSGDLYMTGSHSGTLSCGSVMLPSAASNNAFVVGIDPTNGSCHSGVTIGGAGQVYGFALAAPSDDKLVLAGSATSLDHPLAACPSDDHGGWMMTLSPSLVDQSNVRCFGETTTTFYYARIAATPTHVAMTGVFEGGPITMPGGPPLVVSPMLGTFYANLAGDLSHQSSVGFVGPTRMLGVARDSRGHIVHAGHTEASAIDLGAGPMMNTGASSAVFAKRDENSALLWSAIYASPGQITPNALAADGDAIWTLGLVDAATTLGDIALVPTLPNNIFILRLDPVLLP